MKTNREMIQSLRALCDKGKRDQVMRADELVLFGSRASKTHSRRSDFDILCVGTGDRIKTGLLDVVWISRSKLLSDRWLGSELAGHVSQYGQWLKGEGSWRERRYASTRAIERKRSRVRGRIDALSTHRSRLYPVVIRRYSTTIRRDMQRLWYLLGGLAVPSTPELDSGWAASHEDVLRTVESSGAVRLQPWLIELLGEPRVEDHSKRQRDHAHSLRSSPALR